MESMRADSAAPVVSSSLTRAYRLRVTGSAYLGLLKPHVTVLLLGVTLASMAVASGGSPPPALMLVTLFGGACAAGSANALNCYWDRDIDQLMSRTRRRALPIGAIPPAHALVFGLALGVISFVVLARFATMLAATLAVGAILFYVVIYTMWLKRATPQNIVIGGAAGAAPVLIGWAAVTNGVPLEAWWMFAIIFMWTPPHFWALSLLLQKDYQRAGIPMLPVVKGEQETRRQIVLYSVLLLLTTLGPALTHEAGMLYVIGALLSGGALLWLALRLSRTHALVEARTLFWCSNYYLVLIFTLLVVDRVWR